MKEVKMVLIPVLCSHCQSNQVIRGGKTKAGKQRYKCQNSDCPHYSFQVDLIYKGRSSEVKEQIIDMALNGSGIRDTAQVLKISTTTVIHELKKASFHLILPFSYGLCHLIMLPRLINEIPWFPISPLIRVVARDSKVARTSRLASENGSATQVILC